MLSYKPKTKKELQALVCDAEVNLGDIDTSRITDMSELFEQSKRENWDGLESWDVSAVRDMGWMFLGCENFNHDISLWDVKNVESFECMFYGCEKFDADLSLWDVGQGLRFDYMFYGCKSFNQDISSWDMKKAKNLEGLFCGCKNFNQNLSSWDISGINDVLSLTGMFFNCCITNEFKPDVRYKRAKLYTPKTKEELKALVCDAEIFLGDIDTSHITDMSELFCVMYSENGEKISERKEFQGLQSWEVGQVTDMYSMFENCIWLNQDISSWDVSAVVCMDYMFKNCVRFNQKLDTWDVKNVKTMYEIFSGCENFDKDISSWDVSNVEDMSWMFFGCKSFAQNLSKWDIKNLLHAEEMFANCSISEHCKPKVDETLKSIV